jgi:hypothetical protein
MMAFACTALNIETTLSMKPRQLHWRYMSADVEGTTTAQEYWLL